MAGFNGTAKGLCRSHYKRYLRYGNPEVPLRKIASWKGQGCLHVGCDRLAVSMALCEMHYVAKRRKDNPELSKKRLKKFSDKKKMNQEYAAGRPRPEVCELCGEFNLRIVFDHCHQKGHFRGWLCDRCNKVLGIVKDSPALLRGLASYLEDNDGETYYESQKLTAKQGL